MASADQILTRLLWLLLAAAVLVGWQAQQTARQVDALRRRLRQQDLALAPLAKTQATRRAKNEARWAGVADDLKRFGDKLGGRAKLETELRSQLDGRVARHTRNATRMAEKVVALAEGLVAKELTVLWDSHPDLSTVISSARQTVLNLVKLNFDSDANQFFRYDMNEIEYLNGLDQNSPILATHVRRKLWVTPSPRAVPYVLRDRKKKDHSEGQLAAFQDIFAGNRKVFFIECGGLDGEDFSNTLEMEMKSKWTGVLVEASPIEFDKLLKKKRKSVLVPTCLSLEPRPTWVTFAQGWALGKIVNASKVPANLHSTLQVHCMPFYSVYQAIGRAEIDLFVLDIEGHEMEVLHTIPWDKVNILVLMVEFIHGKFSKDYMRDYMLKRNYRLYNGTKQNPWSGQNHLFIKVGSRYDQNHS